MRQLLEANRTELRKQMAEYRMPAAEEVMLSSQKAGDTESVLKYERLGIQEGASGGLAMMAFASIWFLGALSMGVLFPYASILFLIGLRAFIDGIVTGTSVVDQERDSSV